MDLADVRHGYARERRDTCHEGERCDGCVLASIPDWHLANTYDRRPMFLLGATSRLDLVKERPQCPKGQECDINFIFIVLKPSLER